MAFVQGGAMKNAEDVAVKILDDHWGICEGSDELQIAIAKALQVAYQKGAEDMRMRAAAIAEAEEGVGANEAYGCSCGESIAEKVNTIPLHPEGGGR